MWDRWVPQYAAESYTVQHLVDERLASRPFKETYHYMKAQSPLRWSNEDLAKHTKALAVGLIDMGYKRSAKIATWCNNESEMPVTTLAAGMSGNHHIAIDPDLPVTAVAAVLRDLGCRGLIFSPRHSKEDRAPAMSSIVPTLSDELQHRGRVINHKPLRDLRHLIDLSWDLHPSIMNFVQILAYSPNPSPLPEVRRLISADWPLFTAIRSASGAAAAGGSTWEAGKTLSTNDAVAFAKRFNKALNVDADSTVLITAPMHTALATCGAMMGAMVSGGKVVLVSREFDAKATLETLTKQRVTTLLATADQLVQLEAALKEDAVSAAPKYGAPFLRSVIADVAAPSAAGAAKATAPSKFLSFPVIQADSRRDDAAL